MTLPGTAPSVNISSRLADGKKVHQSAMAINLQETLKIQALSLGRMLWFVLECTYLIRLEKYL